MALERIDDRADPRVAAYRSLRDRDLRGHEGGLFVVEGEVPLRVLLGERRFAVRSLLLSDKQAARLGGLLAQLPAEVPVYLGPVPLLEEIVGFNLHRGVLALGERGAPAALGGLLGGLPERALVVALAGVVNHDNVGGVFRNAAAFAVDAVALDGVTCDPLYRKAIRVSVGASLVVPFARAADEPALLAALIEHGFTVLALSPQGAHALAAADTTPAAPVAHVGRLALLAGAEGPGLSAETLRACRTLRIPMAPRWDSLNVAVATGIALHWLATTRDRSLN
jgi:tRNA G18 (ribose-2'-O)-methylase SpoU